MKLIHRSPELHPTRLDELRARTVVMFRNLFPVLSGHPRGQRWECAGRVNSHEPWRNLWHRIDAHDEHPRLVRPLATLGTDRRATLAAQSRGARAGLTLPGYEARRYPQLALGERIGHTAVIAARLTDEQVRVVEDSSSTSPYAEVVVPLGDSPRQVAVGFVDPDVPSFVPFEDPEGYRFNLTRPAISRQRYEDHTYNPDATVRLYPGALAGGVQ